MDSDHDWNKVEALYECTLRGYPRGSFYYHTYRQLINELSDDQFKSLYAFASDMMYMSFEEDGSWWIPAVCLREWVNTIEFDESWPDSPLRKAGSDSKIAILGDGVRLRDTTEDEPSDPKDGDIYIRATDNQLRMYDGNKWLDVTINGT